MRGVMFTSICCECHRGACNLFPGIPGSPQELHTHSGGEWGGGDLRPLSAPGMARAGHRARCCDDGARCTGSTGGLCAGCCSQGPGAAPARAMPWVARAALKARPAAPGALRTSHLLPRPNCGTFRDKLEKTSNCCACSMTPPWLHLDGAAPGTLRCSFTRVCRMRGKRPFAVQSSSAF